MAEPGLTLQTNFSYGELSPDLQGYINLPDYVQGLLECENFLNGPNGGVAFRSGTAYAGNALGANVTCIPFVFNSGASYLLVASDYRIRFFTSNGPLNISYNVTAATWASNVATLTLNATPCFQVGDSVTVASVSPNGYNGTYTVTAVSGSTISYALGSNPGTYSSGGTAAGAYQVVTPLTQANIGSWTQSDDVLYVSSADGTVPIQQITQLGTVNWTCTSLVPTPGPLENVNTDQTSTIVVSSTDGLTCTASYNIFASTDVGRNLLLFDLSDNYSPAAGQQSTVEGSWKWGTIASYTNAYTVKVDKWQWCVAGTNTTKTFINTNAPIYQYALGSWSGTTGYPTAVGMYEQRLLTGGEAYNRQMLRGSQVGVFTCFIDKDPDGTVNPDNSYAFQIVSGQSDGIIWISSNRWLILGTTSAEYLVSSSGPAITPTDVSIKKQTNFGSTAGSRPASLNYRLYFMQRGTINLQQWAFEYFVGGFRGEWANQMSATITYPGVKRLDYMLTPYPRLLMLRTDGQLVVGTDMHKQGGGMGSPVRGTLGFTRIIPGGTLSGGAAAQIVDMAVLPTTGFDQLWMVVKRYINGAYQYHVEYMTTDFNVNPVATMANAWQVDSAIPYNGASTSTLSGYDHLIGQSVYGWDTTNAVPLGPITVASDGSVTLPAATSSCVLGLSYTGTLKTMPLAVADATGRIQYPIRAFLRLYQTYGGNVLTGPTFATTQAIAESTGLLYSGQTRNVLNQGSSTDAKIVVQQTSPYPMTLLSATLDFQAGIS